MSKKADNVKGILPPPRGLSTSEKALWQQTITAFPSGYFSPADAALMVEYCRAVSATNRLAKQLETVADPAKMRLLFGIRDAESRRACAIARSLRIPPQSRYDRQAAATAHRRAGQGAFDDPHAFDEF